MLNIELKQLGSFSLFALQKIVIWYFSLSFHVVDIICRRSFLYFMFWCNHLSLKIFAFSPKIFRSITRNRWYNMVVLYVFLALCFICTIPSLLHYIFIYLFLFFLKKNFIGLLQWQNDLLLLGKLPNSAFSGNPSLSKTKIVLSV